MRFFQSLDRVFAVFYCVNRAGPLQMGLRAGPAHATRAQVGKSIIPMIPQLFGERPIVLDRNVSLVPSAHGFAGSTVTRVRSILKDYITKFWPNAR
jgi:hypothetical protein